MTLTGRRDSLLPGLLLAALATNALASDPASGDAPPGHGRAHEAFLLSTNPESATDVVASKPPQTLAESPPAQKPVSSAVWLPGYWTWESAAQRYQWVPAIWRIAPPGMRWLPGYWSPTKDGWRWVRGFWVSAKEPRIRYLPEPPPPKDEPPSKASAGSFVVPGYWSYADGKYVWKRAYLSQSKAGWLWTAAHYLWTPRGHVFLPGYWDLAIGHRGEAFTPPRTITSRPTYSAVRAADALNKLIRLRQQFETSGENANATGPATLELPTITEIQTSKSSAGGGRPATEESLPGVVGRQVPGARQRALPGVSGRSVPGVEADLPDVAAPGINPREIQPRP